MAARLALERALEQLQWQLPEGYELLAERLRQAGDRDVARGVLQRHCTGVKLPRPHLDYTADAARSAFDQPEQHAHEQLQDRAGERAEERTSTKLRPYPVRDASEAAPTRPAAVAWPGGQREVPTKQWERQSEFPART